MQMLTNLMYLSIFLVPLYKLPYLAWSLSLPTWEFAYMLCTVILGHEFLAGLLQESDVIISLVVILHQADWLLNHQYFHSCQ